MALNYLTDRSFDLEGPFGVVLNRSLQVCAKTFQSSLYLHFHLTYISGFIESTIRIRFSQRNAALIMRFMRA
jgi:hypothetical protein